MKRILITGAGGMLGLYLSEYLSNLDEYHVTATSRKHNSHISADTFIACDLTVKKDLENLTGLDFDVVVHCAALTNIEKCESENEFADHINEEATKALAHLYPESLFIYISTDAVFDGIEGGYREMDKPAPVNYYAHTKLKGEDAVSRIVDSHYILRTNIYGFHRPTRLSLFEWVYEQLAKGNPIGGFTDVFFNPLYIGQVAEVIDQLIKTRPAYGIYNATIDENISKHEFLQQCAAKFGFPPEMILEAKLPTDGSVAPRPRRTYLKNNKLKDSLKNLDLSINYGINMLYKDFVSFQEQVKNNE